MGRPFCPLLPGLFELLHRKLMVSSVLPVLLEELCNRYRDAPQDPAEDEDAKGQEEPTHRQVADGEFHGPGPTALRPLSLQLCTSCPELGMASLYSWKHHKSFGVSTSRVPAIRIAVTSLTRREHGIQVPSFPLPP